MKNLFNQIIQEQDFGLSVDSLIEKKKKTFGTLDKLVTDKVVLYAYRINYRYKTKRGNIKINHKILILNQQDKDEAIYRFLLVIENCPKYKKISNVEILDIQNEELVINLK